MRRCLSSIVLLLSVSATLSAGSQGGTGSQGTPAPATPAAPKGGTVVPISKCSKSGLKNNLYRFCFDHGAWLVDEPSNLRFTNRDRVEVEIVQFNYLRYTLSFDVQEQKSDSYQYLTKLWTSVLGIGFGSLGGALGVAPTTEPARSEFLRKQAAEQLLLDHLREVLRYSEALDTRVSRTIGAHQKSGLDEPEAKALKNDLSTGDQAPCTQPWTTGEDPLLKCPIEKLSTLTTDKYMTLERGVHLDTDQFAAATGRLGEIYQKTQKAYADVNARFDQFDGLANKSLGTTLRKVGKRDAGVRVTLTLAAVDAGGGKTPMGDVSYFVETTIPLVVHGGLAFSTLRDVTFEKVKRSNGFSEDDVFQKTGDNANSKNFSLYLGWRFASFWGETPNNAKLTALFSLGTAVDSPGQKIYVGPTLIILNRVGLTFGGVLGKEQDGQQVTLEPDVFKIIKAKPTVSPFFSITTKVY